MRAQTCRAKAAAAKPRMRPTTKLSSTAQLPTSQRATHRHAHLHTCTFRPGRLFGLSLASGFACPCCPSVSSWLVLAVVWLSSWFSQGSGSSLFTRCVLRRVWRRVGVLACGHTYLYIIPVLVAELLVIPTSYASPSAADNIFIPAANQEHKNPATSGCITVLFRGLLRIVLLS